MNISRQFVQKLSEQNEKFIREIISILRQKTPIEDFDINSALTLAKSFQFVHVLSLIHSKNYIKNESTKEFTTTIYKNLFEKDSSEIRNLIQKYTDLKQEPLENQIKIFSEDLLNVLIGKNIGIVYGQIFFIPCIDFLYRNLGLTANIFEDKETTVEMAKLVKKKNDFD